MTHCTPRPVAEKLTGFNRAQLDGFSRKGIMRIIKVNARVFVIPDEDLVDLPARIIEANRRETMTAAGVSMEIAAGLTEIFGYVPGGRA